MESEKNNKTESQNKTAKLNAVKEAMNPNHLAEQSSLTSSNAKERVARVVAIINADPPSPQPEVTQDGIAMQIENLTDQQNFDNTDFLQASSQALATVDAIITNTVSEQAELERTANKPYFKKRDLEDKQKDLEKPKGIKKIIAPFQRWQNKRTLKTTETILSGLNDQVNKKRDLVDKLSNQQTELQKKRDEVLLNEIGSNISLIKNSYENLYKEVLADESVVSEIRQQYIEGAIAPIVDKISNEHGYPVTKKEELYKAIDDYIAHRDEPNETKKVYRQNLENLLTYDNGFYDAGDRIRSLVDGADKRIIQRLIVKMAANDIRKIKSEMSSKLHTYNSKEKFKLIFEKSIDSTDRWSRQENSFSGQLLQEFNEYSDHSYPNIEMWLALKRSNLAREIFGQEIINQDQEIYTTAIEESLSDQNGAHIDMLYYYPTPDAIRNLIVIAAADNVGYRMVHANTTLDNLAKKPEYKQILDSAQERYPEIKQARADLENWNHREYYTHPTIRQNSSELAKAIYDQEASIDPRLTELSARALSNTAIINILNKRGVLNEQDFKQISEAHLILGEMSKESWDNRMVENYKGRYVSDYAYQKGSREVLFSLLMTNPENITPNQKELIRRFSELSKFTIDQKNDDVAIAYLTDNHVIVKLQDLSLTNEQVTKLLYAYQDIPQLVSNGQLLEKFCEQFKGEETIVFYQKALLAYKDTDKQLTNLLSLLGESKISQETLLSLPVNAKDILTDSNFSIAVEFPQLYLEGTNDNDFFRKIIKKYNNDNGLLGEVSRSLNDNQISREMALIFPDQGPLFMTKQMRETRSFIFINAGVLLKDTSDVRFLNNLAGEFGHKSDQLIRGYNKCLQAESVTTNDKDLVLEFVKQFRVISPMTLGGYKEAKLGGYEKVYIAKLQSLAEKMTGGGKISEDEQNSPYYKDLLVHVYSNNSGHWGSLENNLSCSDRSEDLSEYKIRPVYQIDLLSQSEIKVKEGQILNNAVKESVQIPILKVAQTMTELGGDPESIKSDLDQRLDKAIFAVVQNGGLEQIDLSKINTPEEKLFLIMIDSVYGTNTLSKEDVKNLVITYDFTNFENINDYINGTTDRVGRASNQDYALLCEVSAFYSDRVKDVNKKIVTDALTNTTISQLMPVYFQRLSQDSVSLSRKDAINRLQVDKLGLTDSFVKQMGLILQKRNGRSYSPTEVKNIIRRYERATNGLVQKASASQNQQTKAFYGQIRSQREKIFNAFGVITGKEIDPSQTYLGEINLQDALASEANIREGKYDPEQFSSYTAQRFIDIFESERSSIQQELDKFESVSGKKREVLNGYIAKTKESANARMVAGVCVSGDNPNKNPQKNLWDMPNYLQMVFQEPDTLQCQGAVLMHTFYEDGKKVLAISPNPSSTYVYSVDEAALFNGIANSLEVFADENNFDLITISTHKNIRTNRTGGEFERAMDRRISKVGKKFTFQTEKQFSFSPDYRIKEMDIIWERKTT